MDKRRLVRVKAEHDSLRRLQKQWDILLTNKGLSMNRGLTDKLSYAGGTSDLVVLEKLQGSTKSNQSDNSKI